MPVKIAAAPVVGPVIFESRLFRSISDSVIENIVGKGIFGNLGPP
jgi:hypothetical protein